MHHRIPRPLTQTKRQLLDAHKTSFFQKEKKSYQIIFAYYKITDKVIGPIFFKQQTSIPFMLFSVFDGLFSVFDTELLGFDAELMGLFIELLELLGELTGF